MPVRLYHKVAPNADGAPGTARTLVINRLAKEETDSALLDAELRFTRFFNNTPIAIAATIYQGKNDPNQCDLHADVQGPIGGASSA